MDAFSSPSSPRPRAQSEGSPLSGTREDAAATSEGETFAPGPGTVLDTIAIPVLAADARGTITSANPAATRLLARGDAVVGRRIEDLLSLRDELTGTPVPDPVLECLAANETVHLTCRARPRRRRGVESVVELTATPVADGAGATGAVVVVHDISRTRALLRKLEHEARHDALTKLMNRAAFHEHFDHVARRMRDSDEHALLYLDLDRFKSVNDTCGHAAGDDVLRQVATVLARTVRQRDTLARLGGDEFALLLEHCPHRRALRVARDLRAAVLARGFRWRDRSFPLDVSIGVVRVRGPHADPAALIAEADRACYAAKRRADGVPAGVPHARPSHPAALLRDAAD